MLEVIFLLIFVSVLYSQHPFSFGAIMLLLSIVLGGLISSIFGSWYGFVLFLIFVGGLLVLFAYTCALTPNFSEPKSVIKSISGFTIPFVGLFFFYLFYSSGLSINFIDGVSFGSGVSMGWGVLVTSFVWDVSIVWLVSVLFLTMILVAHVCKKQGFPLRAFSKK